MIIRFLVECGADLEAVSLESGSHNARTPLQTACTVQFNVESIRTLLDLGAEIGSRSGSAYSSLDLAILSNSSENLTVLLEEGRGPIEKCAALLSEPENFLERQRMVFKLLDIKAYGSALGIKGRNMFHYLASCVWLEHHAKPPWCYWWQEMFNKLLRCGADPAKFNADGETAFWLAVRNLKAPYLRLLLDGSMGSQYHVSPPSPYDLMQILANIKNSPSLQKAKEETLDVLIEYQERCSAGDISCQNVGFFPRVR